MEFRGIFLAPADAPGIKKDDIVAEFGPARFQDSYKDENGKKVDGVYDYTRFTPEMLEKRINDPKTKRSKNAAEEIAVERDALTQLNSVVQFVTSGSMDKKILPKTEQPKSPVQDVVPDFIQNMVIGALSTNAKYIQGAEFVKGTTQKILDVLPFTEEAKKKTTDFVNSSLDLNQSVKPNINKTVETVLTPVAKLVQDKLGDSSAQTLVKDLTEKAANVAVKHIFRKKTPKA